MDANYTILHCFLTEEDTKINCNGTIYSSEFGEEGKTSPTDWLFWVYLLVYIFLVMFAGLMSGLTIGLLSLDILSLEVLKKSGNPRQRRYAARIVTLVKRHHLLLVTLLLANAIAVESMPIFLDKITNEIVAILVSVTAVLLFGEIIPQALCTRFGLAIGYYCAPMVYFLMFIFFIIAFPIAKLLDCLLGKGHGTFFRRAELKELVQLHGKKEGEDNSEENIEALSSDEVLIVKSALEMRDKTVKDSMTPLESVFMLDIDDRLGDVTMDKINLAGYSRVPVYENTRDNITGILLVKKLIKYDPEDKVSIRDIEGAMVRPPSCSLDTPLFDILNMFQTGKSHLYIVYDETELNVVGIITLEDVVEEIIGEEIVDETDVYIDVHRRIAVARTKAQIMKQQNSDPTTGGRGVRSIAKVTTSKQRKWLGGDSDPPKVKLLRSVPQRSSSIDLPEQPSPPPSSPPITVPVISQQMSDNELVENINEAIGDTAPLLVIND